MEKASKVKLKVRKDPWRASGAEAATGRLRRTALVVLLGTATQYVLYHVP